jgi:hypothetical protein
MLGDKGVGRHYTPVGARRDENFNESPRPLPEKIVKPLE